MDSDNIPLDDPAQLFESPLYQEHGTLFWPDFCNMVSFRRETFGVFGLPEFPNHPQALKTKNERKKKKKKRERNEN